jgi:hypothetical protein
MADEQKTKLRLEIAHVLFMDILRARAGRQRQGAEIGQSNFTSVA